MIRVLFIAYYFPPVGGAGVQRSLKFVRYLPEFGIEPVVITGPVDSIGDQSIKDETLDGQLPGEVEVLRVAGPEPTPSRRWRRRAERWLRLERPWRRWWIDGVAEVARRAPEADAVFATMSPFESAEAARLVAADRHVPWVADLRDPWALDEMFVYPSLVHRRIELRTMRHVLSTAAAVVMNTPEAAAALQTELGARQLVPPVYSITNGFDAHDFRGPIPDRTDSAFRIVHTGELHTALGLEHRQRRRARRILRGDLGAVDILPRSHVYLLKALERLREVDPGLGARVELHLAGKLSDADRRVAASATVPVEETGYLTHGETVALLRSADMLFLPMHDVAEGIRTRIVPGKTYEYLAAERPILAAIPAGDAEDFLVEAGGAYICRPTDVEAMADAIKACAAAPPSDLSSKARQRVIARFERRELASQLAELLERVARTQRYGTEAVSGDAMTDP